MEHDEREPEPIDDALPEEPRAEADEAGPAGDDPALLDLISRLSQIDPDAAPPEADWEIVAADEPPAAAFDDNPADPALAETQAFEFLEEPSATSEAEPEPVAEAPEPAEADWERLEPALAVTEELTTLEETPAEHEATGTPEHQESEPEPAEAVAAADADVTQVLNLKELVEDEAPQDEGEYPFWTEHDAIEDEADSFQEAWNEQSADEHEIGDLAAAFQTRNGAEPAAEPHGENGYSSDAIAQVEINSEAEDAASASCDSGDTGFGASSLEIHRIEPESAGADQPVTYGFIVRNTAPVALSNVQMEHTLPPGAKCIGVLPRPEVFGNNKFVWRLGDMKAGAEECFLIRVVKTSDIELPTETTAVLHACYYLTAVVAKPRLVATLSGPDRVKVGQPVELLLEVKNAGNARARDLALRIEPAAGLELQEGETAEARLGHLAPGATLQAKIKLQSTEPGPREQTVTISGPGGTTASAQAELLVTKAVLEVRAAGPVKGLVDQPTVYRVEVANTGTAPIEQSLVINTLDRCLEFVSCSEGGEFDDTDHSVTWVLGGLSPGERRGFSVQVKAKGPGEYIHRTVAWSDCGLEVDAEAALVAEIDESQSSHLLEDLLEAIDREDEAAAKLELPELAEPLVPAAVRTVGRQYVAFTMGDADYAIPIDSVLEYGHPLSVTPVPSVPDWVLGVANLHGDIVSMVDLRMFLGMERPGSGREGRMLVVRNRKEDLTVGLVVDRVKGIRVVADEQVHLPASPVENRLSPYLRGVAAHQGRLIILLNLDQLLLSPEMRQFEPI